MGRAEFSGNYSHNIDPKGRATIPAAYREALSEGFTIGLNNDFNAIALYPAENSITAPSPSPSSRCVVTI